MSLTFLFWLSALYTVGLFGAQVAEMVTAARFTINVATANAFYLALLSAYVGGKEVTRWRQVESPADAQPTGFRLKGEWFVGLWAVFLLAASFLSQLWPARFAYPAGLTLIAFEVLGFYVSSSASRWLTTVRDQKEHDQLDVQLSQPEGNRSPAPSISSGSKLTRLEKKRLRYEERILAETKRNGGITREEAQKVTGLSRAAVLQVLKSMVERGHLARTGNPGDPDTLYKSA